MSRFEGDVKVENCLAFEDAPAGVQSAKSAGLFAIMIPGKELLTLTCNKDYLFISS